MHGRPGISVEQVLGPLEPRPYWSQQRRVEEQVHGHTNGGSRGRETIAGLNARRIRALPRVDGHIQMTRGVCHTREKRQVDSSERRARVRFDEELVCVWPVAPGRGSVRPL
jgi:hypothetical protein